MIHRFFSGLFDAPVALLLRFSCVLLYGLGFTVSSKPNQEQGSVKGGLCSVLPDLQLPACGTNGGFVPTWVGGASSTSAGVLAPPPHARDGRDACR